MIFFTREVWIKFDIKMQEIAAIPRTNRAFKTPASPVCLVIREECGTCLAPARHWMLKNSGCGFHDMPSSERAIPRHRSQCCARWIFKYSSVDIWCVM